MGLKYTIENNRPLNFWEKIYFPEIAKGLGVSFRHFWLNWVGKRNVQTKQYPEERFPLSYRARGRHYLTRRSDGRMTCVACMMCAMACPANVIKIEIAEYDEPYYTGRQKIDRYPKTFTIDQLTCIYCGFCVEACPEDAIRMDSGVTMEAVYDRKDAVVHLEDLIQQPKQEHDKIYNPLSGKEPAPAPLEVRPEDEVKKREY